MKSLSLRRALSHHASRAVFGRPAVECLEDRCLPSVVPSVVGPLVDNQGHSLLNVQYPVDVTGELYFSANDGVHGQELFKTNGTQAGTELVSDIIPGSTGSNPSNLTNVSGTLYFVATAPFVGPAIWSCDGTAGSIRESALLPNGPALDLMSANGTLFYVEGTDLYSVRGGQITSGLTVSTDPADFAVLDNRLYFVATANPASGPQVWVRPC